MIIDIICPNCGDIIDTVESKDYKLGIFQIYGIVNGRKVIIDTGGCDSCKYGD